MSSTLKITSAAERLANHDTQIADIQRDIRSINARMGTGFGIPEMVTRRFISIESELRQKARADTTNEAKQLAKKALEGVQEVGRISNYNATNFERVERTLLGRLAAIEKRIVGLEAIAEFDAPVDLGMTAADLKSLGPKDSEPRVTVKAAQELAKQVAIYATHYETKYGSTAVVDSAISSSGGVAMLIFGLAIDSNAWLIDVSADGEKVHFTGYGTPRDAREALKKCCGDPGDCGEDCD